MSLNDNNKRPLSVTPVTSASPTRVRYSKVDNNASGSGPGPTSGPAPLKRDPRMGKYFEYDLSKMVNSKGGFLVEDEKEVNEDMRILERERERERALKNAEPREYRYVLDRDVYRMIYYFIEIRMCKDKQRDKKKKNAEEECG